MRQPERLRACVYTITHWNKSPISFLKPTPFIHFHPFLLICSHPMLPDQLGTTPVIVNRIHYRKYFLIRGWLSEILLFPNFFLFPYELYVGESSRWNGRRNISAGSEKWLLRGQYIALEWWFCEDGEMDFVKEKLHKEFVILFWYTGKLPTIKSDDFLVSPTPNNFWSSLSLV